MKFFKPFVDAEMVKLGGIILKGDHSFKIIKKLGKINSSSVFTVLYTVCNEYEEVVMMLLVHTKSLTHLEDTFTKFFANYEYQNQQPPIIFFTDNILGDQAFLEKYPLSLRTDVQHVIIPKAAYDMTKLPLLQIPANVKISMLTTKNETNDLGTDFVNGECDEPNPVYLGFDIEWVSSENGQWVTEAGLRCEGWEDKELLQGKIDYAALDAWVALELFDHFKNIPISNVPLDANSISIGQNVAIFSSFKNLPVAYGIAEDESITNNNHLSIDQAHAFCDLHANSKHVVLTITKLPLRHGAHKEFMRNYRDALFIFYEDEKKRVTQSIRLGHLSDPVGVPLYFRVKEDKFGLTIYRCVRGTNSVEGGIHTNIIRKFGFYNASPDLAECALADYRLRHNADVARTDMTINFLEDRLGMRSQGSYFDPFCDALKFRINSINDAKLVFGICPFSVDLLEQSDNNTAYAVRLSTHLSESSSPAPNKRQYRAIASSGPVQEAQINGEEPPKKQARKERSCARCKQSNCKVNSCQP
ncbi:hypothetical protein [Parasitella parasitica]|uniref:Uncharacterized protein n=1 Tax=Parasitella parasitica TaxID=35722 RepID=A0A0B7MZR0_9FUNG|nr:hypothetical protein [Parasitella parasitica]